MCSTPESERTLLRGEIGRTRVDYRILFPWQEDEPESAVPSHSRRIHRRIIPPTLCQ